MPKTNQGGYKNPNYKGKKEFVPKTTKDGKPFVKKVDPNLEFKKQFQNIKVDLNEEFAKKNHNKVMMSIYDFRLFHLDPQNKDPKPKEWDNIAWIELDNVTS